MTDHPIDQAAGLLASARSRRERFDRLPEACRPGDERAAYELQDRLHARLRALGHGEIAGYKIGCTTEVMQCYLGIAGPCAGGLLEPTIAHREARHRHADFRRVGVECEIAIRLGDDLGPAGRDHDRASVAAAVGACMAAIEIVDDRYLDYRSLDTPTLIADDFFGAGAVLGDPVADWQSLDLAALEGRMAVNGETVGVGCGRDILGHPFEALAWLANGLIRRGRRLRAGEIVLLGSVVQTRWLEAGDEVEVRIDRLGTVQASFA